MNDPCRLCGAESKYLLDQRVLGQFDVKYFRCPQCDLIQTEKPHWLEQAYSSTIAALDTGAIARNVFCTRLTVAAARLLRIKAASPCLDYGGGHGVFTRMMRDAGWSFCWSDKYGPNLYARGFEGDVKVTHRLVTAFEIFEHLVDVRDELTQIFQPGHDFVLVGTLLHNNPDRDWWYFVPETGQHVAFYSPKTMAWIAATLGYQVMYGKAYSLFIRSGVAVSAWRRMLMRRCLNWTWIAYGLGSLLLELSRGRSLTWKDHLSMKERK
jgi:hypothetical protein